MNYDSTYTSAVMEDISSFLADQYLNTKNKEMLISEIVASDIRKAEVLKKYGIDYCCGGKKTLTQACTEANLNTEAVRAELSNANGQSTLGPFLDYINWDLSFLADYIVNQHHKFYYRNAPLILELASKVATKHGEKNDNYKILAEKIQLLDTDLVKHFGIEENIIFPYIKIKENNSSSIENDDKDSIIKLISGMEEDHEQVGSLLADIKSLTNNFTPEAGSCNSVMLLFSKLSELDNDLKRHIHLENNILFQKFLVKQTN